jgi:predicted nucleic acid-binding protein
MSLPTKVFVDTTFFIALLNSNDNDHLKAVTLQTQLSTQRVRKITSEYVY